jgi:hypothetical protein
MDMHYQPVGVATATLPDVFEAKLVFLSMLAEMSLSSKRKLLPRVSLDGH